LTPHVQGILSTGHQIWVALQNASLFYCTLYTDFPGSSIYAVALYVSFAHITC